MLQVVLAEDHNIVRNGIRMLLELDQEINIAAEAMNGVEVLEYIATGQEVNVILTDINMPEMGGVSLLQEVKALNPDVYVVMLSMQDNEKYVSQAFVEGASGYLLKNVSADELIFSLKHVGMGGKYLCSELAFRMLDKLVHNRCHSLAAVPLSADFSLREIEILHLIAEGMTNTEMSDQLFISKKTVEGHRQSLIEKTGAKNTAALIRYAVLNGIVR